MVFDALPILAATTLGVWDVLWDMLVLLTLALFVLDTTCFSPERCRCVIQFVFSHRCFGLFACFVMAERP